YHVRAYAINSAGTSYGDDVTFTTLADITTFWVVGDYNGWDNSDNAEMLVSTESSNGMAEGYVYLTTGGIKLVTDHSWDNAHTFGDDGSGNLTNPGGNITVAADGYYRVRANLTDMTYSLELTDWGVIGDATPGGWDTDTNLSYDVDHKIWIGGVNLKADGAFKFRANDDWAINYGSSTGDANLNEGGDNIPSPGVAADYAVTLNLSTPNTYTYAANRWGVIGNATSGAWDNDTDLTWDEGNGVFTDTLNLVVGEWKYRANDDWAINLGGDLGVLAQDGGNFAIAEDGNYTITLNPWTLTGTITKN
ncbi:MAG: SusF/SusE family outer membrane protein, partial [Bacteroidales bacterium]|nr:SusF/SusE family outer membrane protein [Bacteroidales bacterium]